MRRVIVRLAQPETDNLKALLFRRYPSAEWATFLRCGWRESEDALVLTIAGVDPPRLGELDDGVGHVAIDEAYTLRMALDAEHHPFAVGIIHSHPQECAPVASPTDDDMDGYYSRYFADFAPDRPYVSLIASVMDGELALSGRVWWRDSWLRVTEFCVERTSATVWSNGRARRRGPRERTARLNSAFGYEAAARLRHSTVAVIGAGGTGSAAIEALARAGVGRLIIVDPDEVSESNLERVHGSTPRHAAERESKVRLAVEHVHAIDPDCDVIGLLGALPQAAVLDAVVTADVALGCTDQQHSRLALSDIAVRYLVPSIDCGVMMEGADGTVTGQILQVVRCLPGDPCVLCRGMINSRRVTEELMSSEEKAQRRAAAQEAVERGDDPDPYWQGQKQLNTVGYLTTMAGAMAAGYAIGWLTGRFDPPFSRLQMNLNAPFLDVTDDPATVRSYCTCTRIRGAADQGAGDAFISAPAHWPDVVAVTGQQFPH